ncbi:hypothetical protein GCM10010174_17070 [Kutzneria viridogrisea]|uniref:Secreted protein n=1 Tax=Kutzneria viridogrisea TaxID=47990 RepID=A0ABR6BE70_9PSEU|nr:hypothetical protein [Kutzneria viridogrisea]
MSTVVSRVVAGTVAALALTGLTGGIAHAGTPVYVLPGVDLGSVLDPTVPVPTEALGPIAHLLTFLHG